MMKWLRKHLFSWISQFILIIVISFFGILVLTIVLGGMPHMQMAIRSVEFWFAMRLSMMTATVSTLICLMLALPTAYALTSRNNPFSKLANILIELPISLPYLVIGLSLLMMFSSDFGKWLKQIGFRVVFDVKGIVFAHVAVNLPFVIRLIRIAFKEIDPRMALIAETLGASQWQQFKTITLSLSRNVIYSTMVLAWSRAIGEFGATLMLVGVTRMKTETLPAAIYLGISTGDNGLAMAIASILLLISCLSLIATNLIGSRGHIQGRVRK